MSTAADLNVRTVKVDVINNWTGANELPFDPIAERVLEIAAHDELGKLQCGALTVVFARPLLIAGKGWACLYKLIAIGREHVSPARGTDSIDALQQAFVMVDRQLRGMRRMHSITFNGSDDLGFGRAISEQAPTGQGCPVTNGSMSL